MTAVVIEICTLYCYYFFSNLFPFYSSVGIVLYTARLHLDSQKTKDIYLVFDNIYKIQFNSLNMKINWSPGAGAHFERDYYLWGDTWWVSVIKKTFKKNITKNPSSPKCSCSNSLLWESIADDSIDINLHVQLNNSIIDTHHITRSIMIELKMLVKCKYCVVSCFCSVRFSWRS